MATSGRKPTPANLLLLHGRGQGRDSAGREVRRPPEFCRSAPEPPDWLPTEARAEWDRVVPELARLDLLKPIDRSALSAYCLIWQRLVDAEQAIQANGTTTTGSQGQLVEHPAVKIFAAASKELRAWCSEFGLSPSSERRLGRASDGDGDAGASNPFAGPAAASG